MSVFVLSRYVRVDCLFYEHLNDFPCRYHVTDVKELFNEYILSSYQTICNINKHLVDLHLRDR